jgi:hypothetical protein
MLCGLRVFRAVESGKEQLMNLKTLKTYEPTVEIPIPSLLLSGGCSRKFRSYGSDAVI